MSRVWVFLDDLVYIAGMVLRSRLLKMLVAAAALIVTVMVPHLVDGTESVWTLTGYAVGMCVAAGTVVQLTASATVQWIVSARPKPVMFEASPKLTPEGEALVADMLRRAHRGEVR